MNNALAEKDILPFGKHKGLKLEDVLHSDPNYIVWMHKNNVATLPDEVVKYAEHIIEEARMEDYAFGLRHEAWGDRD